MSNSLIITKQPSGVFSLQLNGEDVVRSEQNRLTMVGNYCHFKTANGANVVKEQMLLFSEITLITTITETFTSIDQLWQRLIDVGFFGTLGSGGGGGGADKFTELTDTFPSYLGRNGETLIINESQQRIESVPFYNVQNFTQLADAPNFLLANKMITTNDSGTALVMSDIPSLPEPALASVGTFDYADLTTQTTPLSFVTNVPNKLTNDGLGDTSKSFPPYGVTSLWNSIDNSCNFSQLSNGDDTGIRIDITVTTTSSNQIVRGYLKLGVGTNSEYDLQFFSENIKTAGTNNLTFFTKVYIGSDEIRNAPADFYLVSDGNGSVKVNGWYFSVTRRSVNIVSVENSGTTWGSITGTLSDQSDLQSALNLKANLASPNLTGVPTAPTATAGTNTNQVASTAFVLANATNIPQLESNAIDLTVWNNGKGNLQNNTSFGEQALRSNSTGDQNTALGRDSLFANNTGGGNTSLGYNAMQRNTSGNNNTAIGLASINSNTSGSNNVAAGLNSGRFISDGVTVNSITNNSIFIGSSTKTLGDNQTNQIVIGHDATGAGSNTATLGNASITSTILRGNVTTNGNVTATAHVTTGGTTAQFVDGTGSLQNISTIKIYKIGELCIFKNPTNTNASILEAGDMVTGIVQGMFINASYLGGDTTLLTSFDIVNQTEI